MPKFTFSELADIAGCLGFVISLFLAFTSWWKGRMRLSVDIDFDCWSSCSYLSEEFLLSTIAFSFTNKSSNPISINYITLECTENASYRCELEKGYVDHRFRRLIDTDMKYYQVIKESADFPICLNAYGASYQYISFTLPQDFAIDSITKIRITTNHGVAVMDDEETIEKYRKFLGKAYLDHQETLCPDKLSVEDQPPL